MTRRPTPEQLVTYEAEYQAKHARSTPEPTGFSLEQLRAIAQAPDYVRSSFARDPATTLKAVQSFDPFKGMIIASFFLEDILVELEAPPDYKEDRLFTFGRMCVGRDPWEAFDKILPGIEKNLFTIRERKKWAAIPFPQDVPSPTPLLTEWWEGAKLRRGDRGVFPHYLVWRTNAEPSVWQLCVLELKSAEVFERAIEIMGAEKPAELVFGMDMQSMPGQGLEFPDFLTVVWYVDGKFFSGVVDYQVDTATPPEGETEPAFRPIRWDNNYWNHSLHEDYPIPAMTKALGGS